STPRPTRPTGPRLQKSAELLPEKRLFPRTGLTKSGATSHADGVTHRGRRGEPPKNRAPLRETRLGCDRDARGQGRDRPAIAATAGCRRVRAGSARDDGAPG